MKVISEKLQICENSDFSEITFNLFNCRYILTNIWFGREDLFSFIFFHKSYGIHLYQHIIQRKLWNRD